MKSRGAGRVRRSAGFGPGFSLRAPASFAEGLSARPVTGRPTERERTYESPQGDADADPE